MSLYEQQLSNLKMIIQQMESVMVAFSGGVDSALVLYIAQQQLGDQVVAFTGISPTFPPEEQREAQRLAQRLGVKHLQIDSNELEDEGYASNTGNRCYFCKSELFGIASVYAKKEGVKWLADGTIVDDLGDHRPGLQAAAEKQVRHPLVEAGLNKAAVRYWARYFDLPVWDKPSFACLGSRFPVGTRVTLERVQQVQKIESFLRTIGARQFRARWHRVDNDIMIRIEVDPAEMTLFVDPTIRTALVELCKAQGVRWVTMDLIGYQKGGLSMASIHEEPVLTRHVKKI